MEFYSEKGSEAAKMGVCIDIYAIKNREQENEEEIDLKNIKSLVMMSGGKLFLYEPIDLERIAQDIYRQQIFTKNYAVEGLLRIRTSDGFEIVPINNGWWISDQKYKNLFHVPYCDRYRTITFDFQFTQMDGFDL